MRAKKIKNGFTLVELLVVISIISLLMSVLVPALAGVRERAKRLLCSSNIHQCLLASQLYGSDYEDYLPIGNIWDDPSKEEGWLDVSYQMALIMYYNYKVETDNAMCQSWIYNEDDFFKEPDYVDDDNFKVGGTKIGFLYYGGRFDKEASTYSPLLENGQVYKSPDKFSDKGSSNATSNTIFTCYHWDTISSGGNWGAKFPHVKGSRGLIYSPNSKKLDPLPSGMVAGYLDGSAGWVKWDNLKWLEQSNVRMYFSKEN